MSEEKSCQNCGNRCMDMDLEPYCHADGLRKKHPWGLTLSRNRIEGCQDQNYAWWVKDTRGQERSVGDCACGEREVLRGEKFCNVCLLKQMVRA